MESTRSSKQKRKKERKGGREGGNEGGREETLVDIFKGSVREGHKQTLLPSGHSVVLPAFLSSHK